MVVWNGMDLNEELKIYSKNKNVSQSISDDLYINMTNTKTLDLQSLILSVPNH